MLLEIFEKYSLYFPSLTGKYGWRRVRSRLYPPPQPQGNKIAQICPKFLLLRPAIFTFLFFLFSFFFEETGNAKRAEDLVRAASIDMGCSAILSSYPMTGRDNKQFSVHGTMTLALEIGRAIVHGRQSGNPVDELVKYLRTTPYYNHCKVLFDGKVTDRLTYFKVPGYIAFTNALPLTGSQKVDRASVKKQARGAIEAGEDYDLRHLKKRVKKEIL